MKRREVLNEKDFGGSEGRPHALLPERPYVSYRDYLAKCGSIDLGALRAESVLADLARSGLRGRGGAGFPTAVKWRTIYEHACPTRFVVCNAAEGEPGTFKDRYLLRKNPYATIEGVLVAARVVSAKAIYFALRASFQRELKRLREALEDMRHAGVLQNEEIHVVEGPEEYLFGEEKALLNFIEAGEPLPREPQYPPYELGLFGDALSPNPALVNNAETFAYVAGIVRQGGERFRALGTPDTPGTLLFTVSGDVKKPGIYELEAGIPLKALLYDIAGGPSEGKFKVVLSGSSNRVITPEEFRAPCDFASLAAIGSGLGSAGFVVYNDRRSAPRIAQAFARFLYVESCNQCTACKYGLAAASQAIDELFDPQLASADDYEQAMHAARSAPQGNRCFLPVAGSLLIPSLLEKFRGEFNRLYVDPQATSAPVIVPLIKDFDEERCIFMYDTTFARKKPDWTYEGAPPGLAS